MTHSFLVNILRLTPLYRPQPISNLSANSPKIISKQQPINYKLLTINCNKLLTINCKSLSPL